VRFSVVLVAVLGLMSGACGDDDGGSVGGAGGGQLSEQAFCAQLASMEADDADITDAQAIAQLAALARQAPDADMRRALQKFAEVAEDLEGFDEDDPAALSAAFALIFDPEVMAASETIERYLSETCGIDTGADDDWMFDDDLDE
jgi:hypothetical protein